MNSIDDGAWTITLPCARADAERIDAEVELAFGDSDDPPVLVFSEGADDAAEQDWRLTVYFQEKPAAATIRILQRLVGVTGRPPRADRVGPRDWVSLSQEGAPPITAGRFHVRNSESDISPPGLVDFHIPAGRAFGTGQHETTHGCLFMLDRLREAGHRFGNIADIGTGTGLLAFAARSLWPHAHLIAADIDPASVEVTRENAGRNGLALGEGPGKITLVEAAGTDHPDITARAPYDLIIANILAGPLIALAPAFAAHLADGGSLILAGLLDTQAEAVVAACRRAGLRLAARSDNGAWPTLHLRKRRRHGWRRPQRWEGAGASVAPGYGSW